MPRGKSTKRKNEEEPEETGSIEEATKESTDANLDWVKKGRGRPKKSSRQDSSNSIPDQPIVSALKEDIKEAKKHSISLSKAKMSKKEEEDDDDEDEEVKLPKKKTKKNSKKDESEEENVENPPEEDEAEESAKTKEGKKKAMAKTDPAPSQTTDFSKPEIDPSHLKISSWNIAGWKSVLGKGFQDYVKSENPDIICIQETKVSAAELKENFLPGYFGHFNGAQKKGYSGTGMFSKIKPIEWKDGIGIPDHDEEGRVITAEFEKFYLVNTYIPNSGKKLVDLDYRKKWDADFLTFIKGLDSKKPVIWCGDLNVAYLDIDLKNPKPNRNRTAGFSDAERENFGKFLKEGFVDTFRHFSPNEEEAYTFWSFMNAARSKNIGWRLDYFVVSQRAMGKISASYRRPFIMGSDHCPIILHVDLK